MTYCIRIHPIRGRLKPKDQALKLDAAHSVFTVKQNCWRGHDSFSLSAGRLALLIPLPERKYGRWPNTEAYDWWSQWEGSVSKPLCKPQRRHTHISTSAAMPRFLDSKDSLQGDFPFQQLFSSSSNHNQLKDRDLICCHSSPAWFGWQAGSWAAPELMRAKQWGNSSRRLQHSLQSIEAIIRN